MYIGIAKAKVNIKHKEDLIDEYAIVICVIISTTEYKKNLFNRTTVVNRKKTFALFLLRIIIF